MKNLKLYVGLLLCLILVSAADSTSFILTDDRQDQEGKKPPSLDMDDLADVSYLFESPGESLEALKKVSEDVDWNALASYNTKTDFEDESSAALNLGVAVTDALIAIHDENTRQIFTMYAVVNELSEQVGVQNTMDDNKDELAQLAYNGNWDELAVEIENIQADAMNEMQADDETYLLNLVVIGGWLEGIHVLSSHLGNRYNEEHTNLLNQGKIIDYYIKILRPEQATPLASVLIDQLSKMKTVIGAEEQGKTFSQSEIKRINQITTALLKQIQ